MYNMEKYSHRKIDENWYMSVILFPSFCELGIVLNTNSGIGLHWQTYYDEKICQDMLNAGNKFRSRFIWQ